MFWKKRPITHAAALWLLVLAAAAGLIAVLAYASSMSRARKDAAAPSASGVVPAPQPQPPTLFGTVVTFDGAVMKIDSKQPYDEVVVESDTKITTVGGSAVPSSALKTGAVVTATGKDLGGGRMSADAIVILKDR